MTRPATNEFPDFFAQAPSIRLCDPLACFLGTSAAGEIEYVYEDAVRLAGHSCPVVAGAWLMTLQGVAHLYGDRTPERGAIDVILREERDSGVTGVIASIAGLVTGAAPETGFPGLGPRRRFSRRGLMRFGADIEGVMALRRRDNGAGVLLDINTAAAPHDPSMTPLLARALSGEAGPEEMARFARLYQARVRLMLVDMADDPRLVSVNDWTETD